MTRNVMVHIRATRTEAATWRRAARLARMSLSEYLRLAASGAERQMMEAAARAEVEAEAATAAAAALKSWETKRNG